MAAVTVLTRSFFFLSKRPWALPRLGRDAGCSTRRSPRLSAVIAPEVLMSGGQLVATWRDARLFGAVAGIVVLFRAAGACSARSSSAWLVYLPLHVGLGW